MSELSNKIDSIVNETNGMLKDFQRATVKRVDWLFEHGQHRILVADEVGLGKTMIAKGVIALMAKHKNDQGVRNFKVIYVCSNQSIANQNITELDLFKDGHEDISNTRLSMQHLLAEKTRQRNKDKFIQLIPLTPQTSFNQKSGRGMVKERALIFCIMKRMKQFNDLTLCSKLEQMLMYKVGKKTWDGLVLSFNGEIDACKEKSETNYPFSLHAQIEQEKNTLVDVLNHLRSRPSTKDGVVAEGDRSCIVALRKLFAKISVQQLQPDLVIMDEFQNFQFLLNTENEEIKALTDCFFGNGQTLDAADRITKILLLSATPYKLYTTLEEIGDTNFGDHYTEFMDVMKFLYPKNDRFNQFKSVWQDYSIALKEIHENGTSMLVLEDKVKKAEQEMYGGVCRTERISVMDNGDYTDDSSKHQTLKIFEADIKSYIQAAGLMEVLDSRFRIDYVKSCPFALSFMNNYVEKKRLRSYFKQHTSEVTLANNNLLWVDKNKINKYQPLPAVNARYEYLKDKVFQNKSELLLWIPPCCPYYKPSGVYANQESFSKILIFSSWEMVPRMIGSLISYEEERRTIGELVRRHADKIDEQSKKYFVQSSERKNRTRYPAGRLKPTILPMFSLIYPSEALCGAYNPMGFFADGIPDINSVERSVKKTIHEKLTPFVEKIARKEGNRDRRWYHFAPMLLDDPEIVVRWMDGIASNAKNQDNDNLNIEDGESSDDNANNGKTNDGAKSLSGIVSTIRKLFVDDKGTIHRPNPGSLGRVPDDLEDVMVSLAMASPAVCLLRTLKNSDVAARIARDFVRYFNSPESTAIVELACSKKRVPSEDSHWLDVLNYCKMGNIQAMLDEFVHLLRKGYDIASELDEIEARFHECLTLHSSPYIVDTYKEFSESLKFNQTIPAVKRLRTHYAAGFSKGDSTDKTIARKDNLRNAFNSPFWPFVLASTSIGQEGLDFHLYCRKIMHWNLPSNPIDLEQREGRINRFKCLAIRQNVARKYMGEIKGLKPDYWDELFDAAVAERKEGQSELIPYWCFGKNQEVKIERLLPLYPISKDTNSYDRLIKILSLYRLTLGQTRQEDLLEHVFNNFENIEPLKELFINLSPYSHQAGAFLPACTLKMKTR